MIRTLAVILSLWSAAAVAAIETWPALYDVTGVEADDALNIRTDPTVASDIIGTLAHDAANIEVVEVDDDHRWGRINTGEGSGWVALRFMERQPRWAGSHPPVTSCYGTEPFWGLTRTSDTTILDLFGDVIEDVAEVTEVSSSNRVDRFGLIFGASHAIIVETICSDGMSDRTFGLSIDILTEVDGTPMHLSGCCSIQPD